MSLQQRYRVLERLGTRRSFELFVAESQGLEGFKKRVLIKRVLPHLSSEKRAVAVFLEASRRAALLDNKNIVSVFDIGVGDDSYFVVCELVDGASLGGLMRHSRSAGAAFPPAVAAFVAIEVCSALAYAHQADSPHGRLNPECVLLSKNGELKVDDFGFESSDVGGLPADIAHLAPETVNGARPSAQADLFGVGTLLWEMVAGRGLFVAATELESRALVERAEVPELRDCPSELWASARKALARDPSERFRGPEDMADALSEFVATQKRVVTARDLARLVRGVVATRPAPARQQGSIVDKLIQEALVEFDSLSTGVDASERTTTQKWLRAVGGTPESRPSTRDPTPPATPDEAPTQAAALWDEARIAFSPDARRPRAGMTLVEGERVQGRYMLEKQLGSGAFGEVYSALDTNFSTPRKVAIKFLKRIYAKDEKMLARFRSEVNALASIKAANVVAVQETGSFQGRPFIITEYVDGVTLETCLKEYKARKEQARRSHSLEVSDQSRLSHVLEVFDPAKLGDVLGVFDQVCRGVGAAHRVRSGAIVHRDLKPGNIMLEREAGGDLVVKVLDFGLARLGARAATGTQRGYVMGTELYMAPEQRMGRNDEIKPWTDVFALGVILVELLTLEPSIRRGEFCWGTVSMVNPEEVRSLIGALRSDMPDAVGSAIAKALANEPDTRFADAGAMRLGLQAAQQPPPPPRSVPPAIPRPRPSGPPRPPPPPSQRAKPARHAQVPPPPAELFPPGQPVTPATASVRALIIDDDDVFVAALSPALRSHGCSIDVATTETEAYERAGGVRYQLIVVGLDRRVNVFRIVNRLRRSDMCNASALVVVSSVETEDSFADHRETSFPADDYVKEPIDPNALAKRCIQLLEERAARPG